MSEKQKSINEPLIKTTDFSFDHECEKKKAIKNMRVNTSIPSVDEFIAEKIVQSMYPKGEKERENDEFDVFEVDNIIPNQADNEKSIFNLYC